jgi:hypothetical protein
MLYLSDIRRRNINVLSNSRAKVKDRCIYEHIRSASKIKLLVYLIYRIRSFKIKFPSASHHFAVAPYSYIIITEANNCEKLECLSKPQFLVGALLLTSHLDGVIKWSFLKWLL